MPYAYKVSPGSKVNLRDYDPAYTAGLEKKSALERLGRLDEELGALQQELYGAGQHSLLIVLQGVDASGKDGAIRRLACATNPQGCRIESFKAPTNEELSHDFLWRVHKVAPPKGMVGLFNRSHYEDVLVARVRQLVPQSVWKARYEHINAFEALLAASNTIVMKFFLHISKAEQTRRLLERERDALKAWKLSADDWRYREHWGEYQKAFQDALGKCSAAVAPWYIVPADKKWYRDLAISAVLVDTLKKYRAGWRETLDEIARTRRAQIKAVRTTRE